MSGSMGAPLSVVVAMQQEPRGHTSPLGSYDTRAIRFCMRKLDWSSTSDRGRTKMPFPSLRVPDSSGQTGRVEATRRLLLVQRSSTQFYQGLVERLLRWDGGRELGNQPHE